MSDPEPRQDLKRFDNKETLAWELSNEILEYFDLITFSDTEECYVYDGHGIYNNTGESIIKQQVVAKLRARAKRHYISEVVNITKIRSYINRNEVINPPQYICVNNGILDIINQRLYKHNPECKFFSKTPVHYNPFATCPKIQQFFTEIFHSDDIAIVEELIGYSLWRTYHIHRAFLLLGDGANGKSTFLNLLKAFLGKENICAVALQDFDNNRFAASQLYGKLANLYDDLTDASLKQTGKFKILCGSGVLSADRKFRDSFLFENYAKLIFAMNKPPEVKDDTGAFWRRWIFINFPNTFIGSLADPMKLQRITTPGELSGLLNLAIEGLQRLLNKGDFSYRFSPEETRELYLRASDPFKEFVFDLLTLDSDASIPKRTLYNVYVDYSTQNKLPTVADNSFARKLRQHYGSSLTDERKLIDERQLPCWIGIKLKRQSGVSEISANFYLRNKQTSIVEVL